MNSFSPLYFLPALLAFVIWGGILGMAIYSFVLFVKLARRGIKALDIYINEKQSGRRQ